AIEVPSWLSGADASLAEDPAGSKCRVGTLSDKSNAGSATPIGSVCLLCVPRNAVNRRFCSPPTCDTAWLLHFLSFITERHQRIRAHCIRLHVSLLGAEGRTPLENLFIGGSRRSFNKHSNSVAFLRTITPGHGSAPSEREAHTVASSLRGGCPCFLIGGEPCVDTKHDPVPFASQNWLRLLDPIF